ncbi:MAG: translation initiation factor IF-2 N-terminal domain-containing protein [Quinella sp. 2Q5]|nr:translation initiation factor IF-2 N-terminal domain-containing protein [Quinella sp. 2Q5]
MAAKRIYQLAKEFECDEKEIIDFLISQGIKVGNRLSAVSDDTYDMLKAKYTAPPEPVVKPEPEPVVEPVVEPAKPAPAVKAAESAPAKKKNKKSAQPQEPDAQSKALAQDDDPAKINPIAAATQAVYREAIAAGNDFIGNYYSALTKKQAKAFVQPLTHETDTWAIINKLKIDSPDASPVRYWQAVNKLTTQAFRIVNDYGLKNRDVLAEMRKLMMPLVAEYQPREIFSDEENQTFAEQQKLLFRLLGHGMGAVNDNLYALKMHAENMKRHYEMANFVSYATDPSDSLRCAERAPFDEMADTVAFSVSGIVRRVNFYCSNRERFSRIVESFFAWIDGYAKLKEQGAPTDKLEKYFTLEKKFIELVDFFALDNLVVRKKKDKPQVFDKIFDELIIYRDNLDDPDAERNFKYKMRGFTNIVYKPKDFIFIYQLAGLETGVDYRPPEEIAAKAQAANEESPAESDEADR